MPDFLVVALGRPVEDQIIDRHEEGSAEPDQLIDARDDLAALDPRQPGRLDLGPAAQLGLQPAVPLADLDHPAADLGERPAESNSVKFGASIAHEGER